MTRCDSLCVSVAIGGIVTFHFVIDNAVKMCVYYFQFQSFPPLKKGAYSCLHHSCPTASLALLFD